MWRQAGSCALRCWHAWRLHACGAFIDGSNCGAVAARHSAARGLRVRGAEVGAGEDAPAGAGAVPHTNNWEVHV